MSDKVIIEFRYTHDESDCEVCGADWEEGLEIFVNGKLVAGEPANAGCTSKSEYPSLEKILHGVLGELISDYEIREVFNER